MPYVLRYSQYLSYASLGFFVSLFVVTFLIAQILKRYIRYRSVNYASADFVETKPPRKKKRVARILDGIAAFSGGLIFVCLATFSYIPWYAAGILASSWLILYWGIKSAYFYHLGIAFRCCRPHSSLYEDMEEEVGYTMVISDGPFTKKNLNPKQKFVRHSVRQGIPMFFICALMFFFAWASADVCVSMHPIAASTRISRAISGDPCAGRDPCHVYVMVGRDMSREMIVHWHSTRNYKQPTLFFDTVSHSEDAKPSSYRFNVTAVSYWMSKLEVPRYVYYANLLSLSASTKYYIRVGDVSDNGPVLLGLEWNFETAASSVGPNETFHFVSGGDMGRTQVTQDLTDLAGKTNPLFAAIGGDLSYDNGIAACYGRWDAWFDLLENYLYAKQERRIVPLVVSIGNHEAGNFYAPEDAFTFYKAYFVQEPIDEGRDPNKMPTYQSHVIANILLLSLDSYVYATPSGPQADWISNELHRSYAMPDIRFRTAMYHAPQWPSVRKLEDSVSKACREAWSPIFDQYGMDIGFENHDHAYKRTKLMKNGQPVSSNGTLFVGDGSWGVEDGFKRHVSKRFYTDFAVSASFFFNIEVSRTQMKAVAINNVGAIFDTWNVTKL